MRSVCLIVFLVPFTLIACSKKSDGNKSGENSNGSENTSDTDGQSDDTNVGVAGTLVISANLPPEATSTHVAAFPVQGGGVSSQAVAGVIGQPVEAGAVAISISLGTGLHLNEEGGQGEGGNGELSHVMIAYKEGADRFETGDTFKFINVPIGEAKALNLYTGAVKLDKIDLGQITDEDGSFVAENSIKDGDFSIETAVLEELAAGDDALRSIKNAYMNTDPATGESVEIRPFFQWSQGMNGAINNYSPAEAATYFGYGLYFDSRRSDFTLKSLCNESGPDFKSLKLVPPGPLSIGSNSNTGSNTQVSELSNAGAGAIKSALGTREECSGTTFYGHGDSSEKGVGWNWAGIVGPIAEGYWDLFLGAKKVARFDLAAVFPFGSDGKTLAYLPSIKITTEGTRVTNVEIKFSRYVNGVLTESSDLTAFRKIVKQFGVSFTSQAQSGQKEEYKTFNLPDTGATLSPDLSKYNIKWHISNTDVADGSKVDAFAFQYNMYGNDYRFELRPSVTP